MDAGDLIGKPYINHGRGPDGYDCYGLVLEVERRMGTVMPDFEYTDIQGMVELTSEKLLSEGRAVEVGDPVPGALILFRNFRGMATHIGVYLGDDLFIHCHIRRGVCVERFSPYRMTAAGVYVWRK